MTGVTFHKARFNAGYDVYMNSIEAPVVFSVCLLNGKVDTITSEEILQFMELDF